MPKLSEKFAETINLRTPFERRIFWAVIACAIVLCTAVGFVSPYTIFAAILTVGVVALAITRPYFLAVAIAAWTAFEPFLLKFVPDELYVFARYFPEVAVYILAVLVVVHVVIENGNIPYTPLNLPFALLLVSIFASIVVNLVPLGVAALGVRQIVRYIILFFAVSFLAPPKKRIRETIYMFLGIAFFESLLGVFQAALHGAIDTFLLPSSSRFFESIQLTAGVEQFWAPGERIFATMGRYDQLGTFLCFFLLIALGFAYEIKNRASRRPLLIFFLAGLSALVFTYSRASWFGFLLGFIIIGLIIKRDRRVMAVLTIFAAVAVSFYLYDRVVLRYLIDVPEQTITERFFDTFSMESIKGEYYGLGRVYWLIQTPLTVVPAAPFFGLGPGMFGGGAAAALHNTTAYDRLGLPFGVYGTDGQIDSNWMSLWGELGTIGIIIYGLLMSFMVRIAWRVYKKSADPWNRGLALGYIGAFAAVIMQAFLGSYLEVRTLALYLFFVAALIFVIAKREEISV
jgi:O-Antigen ligase